MKVFKPTTLSLLTRCFEHERKFKLGVCVLASVPTNIRPGASSWPGWR